MASSILTELRFALRSLKKTPGFSAAVCGVLALGIGANTSLFTVVHKVLIQPLPFEQSDRLVEIHERSGKGGPNAVSWPNYRDWVQEQRSFETLAFSAVQSRLLPLAEGSQRIPVAFVSGNFFKTYRVQAAIGRVFTLTEDRPEAPVVAVLDSGFWKERFGGDVAVVGETIRMDRLTATIVGVLPEFPWHRQAKVYLQLAHGVESMALKSRENHNSSSVTGRLKPGVTLEQGYADIAAIEARLARQYPGANRDLGIHAVLGLLLSRLLLPALATFAPASIAPRLSSPDWRLLAFSAVVGLLSAALFGAAPAFAASRVDLHQSLKERSTSSAGGHPRIRGGLVSVLATIGIYGVVAYAVGLRRREFAIRLALGSTAGKVIRSVLGRRHEADRHGRGGGLLAAVWLSRLVAGMLYGATPADPWTYAAAAALLLAAGLLATLAPVLRAAHADPAESLRAG
jgi:hypothetical protein